MVKSDIINAIAKDAGISKAKAGEAVESLIATIKKSLKENEPVVLKGFGTFSIKHRAEKKARNIAEGTEMTIPARDVPHFKPSSQFFEEA